MASSYISELPGLTNTQIVSTDLFVVEDVGTATSKMTYAELFGSIVVSASFTSTGPNVVPLSVKGYGSQASDLTQWKYSTGDVASRVIFCGAFVTGWLTAPQITSNQNDWGPTPAAKYRISSDAARDITGLSISQVDGQELVFLNVGASNVTFKHESVSSTAANRFTCVTGADIILGPGERADACYDGTSQRWRLF